MNDPKEPTPAELAQEYAAQYEQGGGIAALGFLAGMEASDKRLKKVLKRLRDACDVRANFDDMTAALKEADAILGPRTPV